MSWTSRDSQISETVKPSPQEMRSRRWEQTLSRPIAPTTISTPVITNAQFITACWALNSVVYSIFHDRSAVKQAWRYLSDNVLCGPACANRPVGVSSRSAVPAMSLSTSEMYLPSAATPARVRRVVKIRSSMTWTSQYVPAVGRIDCKLHGQNVIARGYAGSSVARCR
ncbi:hypothetical protein ROP_pROB02-01720 (plasmid) [Rhodococcus opacus B4]|uniref:Uncharacterized protein n=2 Tax=Rhodococcus TaxID=1827 RepID=C1BDX6_RHOOB|nr:hypothetical protein ROP_pROB02-01720 [Rhodococcus opacus B4]BAQ00550.1 hypothetical protein [Rhodococcus sp. 065240]